MQTAKKIASITLALGQTELQRLPLAKERVMIGRRPHNDLVLDHPTISAEHAVIVTLFNDSFLEDLNSTNGTLVNGQPIKKHFLQHGDVIELAKYTIRYSVELHAPDGAADNRQRAAVFSPTLMLAEAAALAPAQASLEVVGGSGNGRRLPLNKPLTTLGRPGVQVAVILNRADGFALGHLEGTPRPRLNGKTIGFMPVPLQNGDLLELAGTTLRFCVQ